jgi:hypothetical protein
MKGLDHSSSRLVQRIRGLIGWIVGVFRGSHRHKASHFYPMTENGRLTNPFNPLIRCTNISTRIVYEGIGSQFFPLSTTDQGIDRMDCGGF